MKRMLEIAIKHMSDNNKIKLNKISKLGKKLDRKMGHNEFVSTRDGIVIGLVILGTSLEHIDSVKTNVGGRESLNKLKTEILGMFDNEIKEAK